MRIIKNKFTFYSSSIKGYANEVLMYHTDLHSTLVLLKEYI